MSKNVDPDAFKAWVESNLDAILKSRLRADLRDMRDQENRVAEIVAKVREESGIEEGCPLCGGNFDDLVGECHDCGIDILADWEAGA